MKTAIVYTTVHELNNLPAICAAVGRSPWAGGCTIWIVPDRKTPPAAAGQAAEWRARGFDVRYLELEEQERFLSRFPPLRPLVGYDTDNRRNVGFLKALESGAGMLLSLDDDNYPMDGFDFLGDHLVGQTADFEVVYSSNGWFNVCEMLSIEPACVVFPRGYPYRLRRDPAARYTTRRRRLRVGLNVGLWLGDPDIDAVSRNFHRFRATAWEGTNRLLAPGTWTPINTQNTALLAELIPAFWFVIMGERIGGLRVDRFGDIFCGLFCKKVCDTLNLAVRVGAPLCDHRRTEHNLFKDLHEELAAIILLEELTAWLEQVELGGSTAVEAYLNLADALDERIERFSGFLWVPEARAFLRRVVAGMRAWTRTVCDILGSPAPAAEPACV